MPWYDFMKTLPGGQHEMLGRLHCTNDAQATDDLSAAMYPEAQVWQGRRFVGALPPLGAGEEEDLTDQTVRFEPVRMGKDGAGAGFDAGATLRRRPTWWSG